jgi:hypothetical protein
VDSGADDPAALRDCAERGGYERPDRGEDDRGIGLRERKHSSPLESCGLGHDVRRGEPGPVAEILTP